MGNIGPAARQKRMTKQKRTIYSILRATDTHPTAEWIYQQARREIPDISLGTVYRNLQVLRDEGKILELDYGREQRRYDGNPEPHYHFVCTCCGRVLDFDPDAPPVDPAVLAAAPGRVLSHRLECYGVCRDCLAAAADDAAADAAAGS